MRLFLPLVAALLLGAAPPVDRTVDYTLAPVVSGGALTALSVRVATDSSGVTRIAWAERRCRCASAIAGRGEASA